MKNIDINRVKMLARWMSVTSTKEYVTMVASTAIAFLFAMLVALMGSSALGRSYGIADRSMTTDVFVGSGFTQMASALVILMFSVGGCWVFSNMKNKQQRIAFKMLPATDMEKFLVRVLYVSLGWWIGGMLAYCVADVARQLLCLCMGNGVTGSTIPAFFSSMADELWNGDFMGCMTSVLAAIMLNSVYVLGGTLFRRRQFVITTALMFVLTLVVVLLSAYVLTEGMGGWDFEIGSLTGSTTQKAIGSVVYLVISAVCYTLSFRIFRRMQVVNHRWTNL